ncbi:MAG: SpoIIE family protein phosphatase [Candidatus Rifleibacteriota bacterium]
MNDKIPLGGGADLGAWIKFLFVAVFLPVAAVSVSLYHVSHLQKEMRLAQFQVEASEELESLGRFINADEYICRKLSDIFKSSRDLESLKENVISFSEKYQLGFKILIWDKQGEVNWSNFSWKNPEIDWKKAFKNLFEISRGQRDFLSNSEEANLRRIFGPHFFPKFHYHASWEINPRLSRGDSGGNLPYSWVKASAKYGLMVLVPSDRLLDLFMLRREIMLPRPEDSRKMWVLIEGKIYGSDQSLQLLGQQQVKKLEQSYESVHFLEGRYFYKVSFSEKVAGLLAVDQSEISGLKLSQAVIWLLRAGAAFMVLLFVVSFLAFSGRLTIILNIRKQLIFMFLLSSIFPMLILTVLGYDYLIQHENFLKIEAFSKGMAYLQNIDEMYIAEFSHQLKIMDKVFEWLPDRLKKEPPSREMMIDLITHQNDEPFRMVLIGSHTAETGSEIGIMKDGQFVDAINPDSARQETLRNVIDYLGKIGKYYLSRLNKEPISEKTMLQIELIAESLGQIKPIEMLQEFFAATGYFWQWGMGKNYFPAHIRVLSLFNPNLVDYVFLYLYKPNLLQYNYMKRITTSINRNSLGMKIFALNDQLTFSIPVEAVSSDFIKQFVVTMRNKSGSEIEYCDWDGKKHMMIGLKCLAMDRVRLLGLFPVEEITRKAGEKYNLFMASGFLSLLVALSLGLLVSRSFLNPLSQLHAGVEALKTQNFAYRLPAMGKDEFGNLAEILNSTLVDLEEMQVASQVEEKIFADFTVNQQVGNFVFAGKTITSPGSGSDFVDSFPAGSEKTAIAIGDVAGKGIATALVKAYVKASLLQLETFADDPGKILQRIFEVFSQANTGQIKKFMTIQYLVADQSSRKISIASCGHCYPILVDLNQKTCSQVELPSAPLGATSRSSIAKFEIALAKNQMLVLYTGGVYRNPGLAFEDFNRMIIEECENDPASFCDVVLQKILGQVIDGKINDDLTVVAIKQIEPSFDKITQA